MQVEPLHPRCPPVVGTCKICDMVEHIRWMKWNLGNRVIAEKIKRGIAALAKIVEGEG